MKLQLNTITVSKNNVESQPDLESQSGISITDTAEKADPSPMTFSRIFLWIVFAIYIFFTFTLTAIIAALTSSNYNTLFLISQQVFTLSLPVCPEYNLPINCPTPTLCTTTDFSITTPIEGNNRSTTLPMSTPTSTDSAVTQSSSPFPSTIMSISSSSQLPVTDEITFSPSTRLETTTEHDDATSTTLTIDQIPAFEMLYLLNRTEPTLIDYSFTREITCEHPKTIIYLKLELQCITTNYTVETFMVAKDSSANQIKEAKNYPSFLAIEFLFPSNLTEVKDDGNVWHQPLTPCSLSTNKIRKC